MKTSLNSTNSKVGILVKQTLYALQVIIIALAIPVLSYVELSHPDKSQPTQKKYHPGYNC